MPDNLDQDQLDYLGKKGIFKTPSSELIRQLLIAYVQYAYGHLPVLDLHQFLGSLAGSKSRPCVSLLIFQCVMFAGVAFVDVQHLHANGFQTRGDAHAFFFHKAWVSN